MTLIHRKESSVRFCVHCTELSTAMKGGEFIFSLQDFQLFKKDPDF